jgi:phosphotransferase system HPr-like phosphotransfer protein
MLTQTLTIINKRGLHARAAAKFATTSALFSAIVKARVHSHCNSGNWVDLEVQVEGDEAQQALEALRQLIEQRFEEEE